MNDEQQTPTATDETLATIANPAPTNQSPASPTPKVDPLLDQIDINDFMKVAIRAGQITAAELVPKSKKLIKIQVDLGPQLGSRQIVSGIALHYTPESLIGKKIAVVANLKPAQLMGVESNGMLLAGASDDGSILALMELDSAIPLGATIR